MDLVGSHCFGPATAVNVVTCKSPRQKCGSGQATPDMLQGSPQPHERVARFFISQFGASGMSYVPQPRTSSSLQHAALGLPDDESSQTQKPSNLQTSPKPSSAT